MTNVKDIERLFREHYPALVTLATRLVHEQETACDIVHDVFTTLLTDAPAYITPAYLANRVRFRCISYLRTLSVREKLLNHLRLDADEADDWPTDQDIVRLNSLIDNVLTDRTRQVVRLRYNSRMSYAEIAAELSISEAAVYKHLSHAMKTLRQNF